MPATATLFRNGTPLEVRTVDGVTLNVVFAIDDEPGVGTHVYEIWVDDGAVGLARRDIVALVLKR